MEESTNLCECAPLCICGVHAALPCSQKDGPDFCIRCGEDLVVEKK